MTSADETPEAERYYPLRLTDHAADNIDDAHAYLSETVDEAFAAKWEEGLFTEIRRLSSQPYKHDIASLETRRLGRETRDVTYRLRRGGVAYRVFYTVVQSDEEPAFIVILHVRHGSRRAVPEKEAALIRASLKAQS